MRNLGFKTEYYVLAFSDFRRKYRRLRNVIATNLAYKFKTTISKRAPWEKVQGMEGAAGRRAGRCPGCRCSRCKNLLPNVVGSRRPS